MNILLAKCFKRFLVIFGPLWPVNGGWNTSPVHPLCILFKLYNKHIKTGTCTIDANIWDCVYHWLNVWMLILTVVISWLLSISHWLQQTFLVHLYRLEKTMDIRHTFYRLFKLMLLKICCVYIFAISLSVIQIMKLAVTFLVVISEWTTTFSPLSSPLWTAQSQLELKSVGWISHCCIKQKRKREIIVIF